MYGAIWFKETHIRERLIGAIIMISGVIMLAFLWQLAPSSRWLQADNVDVILKE